MSDPFNPLYFDNTLVEMAVVEGLTEIGLVQIDEVIFPSTEVVHSNATFIRTGAKELTGSISKRWIELITEINLRKNGPEYNHGYLRFEDVKALQDYFIAAGFNARIDSRSFYNTQLEIQYNLLYIEKNSILIEFEFGAASMLEDFGYNFYFREDKDSVIHPKKTYSLRVIDKVTANACIIYTDPNILHDALNIMASVKRLFSNFLNNQNPKFFETPNL